MFKQPATQEAEKFAVDKYPAYGRLGNAGFISCDMAMIEWANLMNIPIVP
jgi:hypothetical protein